MTDASQSPPPDRGHLLTEQRSDQSAGLDQLSTLGVLELINQQDAGVAGVVAGQLERIAAFVDGVLQGWQAGGRLIYLGAGTSGRLGVLDASECPPTFQTDPSRVVGLIAGGDAALRTSSEHKEDDPRGALPELESLSVGPADSVLGIAAGGTTPFVLGGVELAKSRGARTGLLVCTPMGCPSWCDVLICAATGPEVVTGSTRMKAGTATKMILNAISTTLMVRLGKTHGDLMVDLRATNDKLLDRAARIVSELTDLDRAAALAILDRADGSVKLAVVMHELGLDAGAARARLDAADGRLRKTLGRQE